MKHYLVLWLTKLHFRRSEVIKVTNYPNEDISYATNLGERHTQMHTREIRNKREIKENMKKENWGGGRLEQIQDKQNDAPSEPTSENIHQTTTLLLSSQQRLEILI